MIFEIVLLALGSAVRPTSLAAVSALLSRESRQRLMLAYVTGGLAFALLFGLVVVGVFHGVHVNAGTDRTRAVADIAGGVLLVLFGIAVLTRTVPRRRKDPSREVGGALTARLDHEITVRVAALAGPLTHIPGIFYLVALNIIVAHNPTLPGGVLAVAIYDAIWFAVPIAALVLCIVDPDAAQKVVVAVEEWTRQHSRTIVPATSFVVGVALVIRGVLSA